MRRTIVWTALSLALISGCDDEPEMTEAQRIGERLDRTAVHFHLALRRRLERPDGREVAAALCEARDSREEARRLAARLYQERERGAEWLRSGRRPTGSISALADGGSELSAESDRAAFLLAMLGEEVAHDQEVPEEVTLYEATQLRLNEVDDPLLRAMARAGRALAMSRVGFCGGAIADADELGEDPPTAAQITETVTRLFPEATEHDEMVTDMLAALSVLGGSARACCEMQEGRLREAAQTVEALLADAEALEVSATRIAILRGWVALARGDVEAARGQLEILRAGTLEPEDKPKYWLLRDALANDSDSSLSDATARLVNQRWLSALALRAVHGALAGSPIEALDAESETCTMRGVAEGHANVIAAARADHPMFDQAHQGDEGPWERIAGLFQ